MSEHPKTAAQPERRSAPRKPRPPAKPYSLDDPIIQAKFWSKVEVPRFRLEQDKCWEWRQGVDKDGYGQFTPSSCAIPLRAHRVAYELLKGPVPPGKLILHSCDNPRCCNPHHLRPGTVADNARDMTERGRGYFNREGAASAAGRRAAELNRARRRLGGGL